MLCYRRPRQREVTAAGAREQLLHLCVRARVRACAFAYVYIPAPLSVCARVSACTQTHICGRTQPSVRAACWRYGTREAMEMRVCPCLWICGCTQPSVRARVCFASARARVHAVYATRAHARPKNASARACTPAITDARTRTRVRTLTLCVRARKRE